MNIERLKENEWFAIDINQRIYHLGNCGDYQSAEEIAEDTIEDIDIWVLIDGITAKQWLSTIKHGLKEANKQ